jgi:CubicO group peptidase (beta-lactamase class C family)
VTGLSLARPEDAGMDPDVTARVDLLLNEAILEGATPGAAVAIGRHGRLVHLAGYGRLDPREAFGAVTDSTIYDLASLTKVVATTTAAMLLVDAGRLDLDAPVAQDLPEWQGQPEKRAVTVRNLLLHNSGLPAWAALYKELRGRQAYRESIARMPLAYAPGTQTMYSDLGIILLAFIIEDITGQSLDRFTQERIFGPLGMRDTGFNPEYWTVALPTEDPEAPRSLFDRIAPSERDTVLRFDYVQGEVHDENAWAIGGVAGHAGLFSSARDLAVFAQFMLSGGTYDSRRLVREKTVREFTRRAPPPSSRALGWDTPSLGSSAGDWFSSSSYGHTGFTGTSIWIDPERDLFVILLMNRVNPTRSNDLYIPVRRQLSNIVQQAIADMTVNRRIE